jgi:hypothetical protein
VEEKRGGRDHDLRVGAGEEEGCATSAPVEEKRGRARPRPLRTGAGEEEGGRDISVEEKMAIRLELGVDLVDGYAWISPGRWAGLLGMRRRIRVDVEPLHLRSRSAARGTTTRLDRSVPVHALAGLLHLHSGSAA